MKRSGEKMMKQLLVAMLCFGLIFGHCAVAFATGGETLSHN